MPNHAGSARDHSRHVYFEVTQDFAKLGAEDIVRWARRHPGQVEIVPTITFTKFQTLRVTNPRTRSRGRGERAALEVLNAAIAEDPDTQRALNLNSMSTMV